MRRTCPRCLRPAPFCPCADLPRVANLTRVLLLQHPREARLAIGSAWLLKAGLLNIESHRGVCFEEHVRARELSRAPGAVLLAPGGVSARQPVAGGTPTVLVVVDATWHQAEKMMRLNPFLSRLPRVSVDAGRPSGYGELRREPAPGCLSTVEAVALALGDIEGKGERFAPLVRAFHHSVHLQLSCARGARRAPRHRPGVVARQPA